MPFMEVHGVEHDELAIAVFNARVLEDGLAALRTGDWATQATTIDLPERGSSFTSTPGVAGRSSARACRGS